MPVSEVRLAGIILAAGTSTRMKAFKPLLPFKNIHLIEKVIENTLLSELNYIALVLGHKASLIQEKIAFQGVRIVVNEEYKSGLSSSIRVGLRDLPEWIDGAMFLLADQPFVEEKIINKLMTEFIKHPSKVIIPTCRGKRGNPVIFPRTEFDSLKELVGDTGGRALFADLKDTLLEVEVADPAILQDLDTREDYRRLVGDIENTHLSSKE